MTLQSSVIVPARPGLIGNPGWARSSAWIWLVSSTERTTAWARIDVEVDDVFELLGELRVCRQLERADAMRRERMYLGSSKACM